MPPPSSLDNEIAAGQKRLHSVLFVEFAMDPAAIDREAFEVLVRSQTNRLWAIAYRVTGDWEMAEDAVQETFLRLLEAHSRLRDKGAAAAWLARVTTRVAIDLARSREARRRREEEHAMAQEVRDDRPERRLIGLEACERIAEGLSRLPLETRAALLLHVVEGVGVREVAATLGTSRSAAWRRIQAGFEDLRRRLRASGFEVASLMALADPLKQLPTPPAPARLFARIEALGASSAHIAEVTAGGLVMSGQKVGVSAAILAALILGGITWMADPFGWTGGNDPRGLVDPSGARTALEAPLRRAGELPGPQKAPATSSAHEETAAPVPGPAALQGKVIDASGKGIAGAAVTALNLKSWNAWLAGKMEAAWASEGYARSLSDLERDYRGQAEKLPRATSGADGSYSFERLDAGEYRVLAAHPHFLPSNESRAEVRAGTTAACDVELVAGQPLAGRVVDESGQPVAGAALSARPSSERALRREGRLLKLLVDLAAGRFHPDSTCAESRRDGSFSFRSLEPIDYDLTARKEGFVDARRERARPGVEGIVLSLTRGAALQGRVLDGIGNPIASARVILELGARDPGKESSPEQRIFGTSVPEVVKAYRGSTGEDGRFRLAGLEADRGTLRIEAGKSPPLEREIVIEGNLLDLGDLALEEPWSISGRVLDPGGKPAAGARVWVPAPVTDPVPGYLEGVSGSEALVETSTGAGGVFVLDGLKRGTADLLASKEGFSEGAAESVEAGAQQVVIVLRPALALGGKVLDAESGSPVAGAAVAVVSRNRKDAGTDAAGAFEIEGVSLAPEMDQVVLRASHPGYGLRVENLRVRDLEVGGGIEILLQPLNVIHGRVVDEKGGPVAGARVGVQVPGVPVEAMMLLAMGEWPAAAFSSAEGAFAAGAPGRAMGRDFAPFLEVVASHPRYASGRVGPLKKPRKGEDWPQVEIVLTDGCSLEGTVATTRGQPVAGAQIRAALSVQVPEEARVLLEMVPIRDCKVAYSDPDGRYRLGRLEPGSYDLEVVSTLHPVQRLKGIGVSGGLQRQDIVLGAGASIAGRVVDSFRSPLAGAEVVAFQELETADSASGVSGRLRELRRRGGSSWHGAASARAGADGGFELANLPEGAYSIMARSSGYEPAEISPARPGDLLPDLVLVRFSAIAGTVKGMDTGALVPRFKIHLFKKRSPGDKVRIGYVGYNEEGFTLAPSEFSNPEGTFVFDGLLSGHYTVTLEAGGYAPSIIEVDLAVAAEERLEVVLKPGTRVRGIVLDAETGKAIAGAAVRYGGRGLGKIWSAKGVTTKEDGTFTIEDLPPGKYFIHAFHQNYYFDQRKCVNVEVPGDEDSIAEVKMQPAGSAKGVVRNLPEVEHEYYYYLAFARIEDGAGGREEPLELWAWIRRWEEGEYSSGSLPPGRYRVALKNKDHQKLAELGEIEVRAGETQSFDAEAPAASR